MAFPTDTLTTVEQTGYSVLWDWKNEYVSDFANAQDGYERFAQYSATPDSTILFAGPARFNAITSSNEGSVLIPIGLADGITIEDNTQLTRLFEIGSNRSFFTRGKNQPGMSFQKLLADQANILYALERVSLGAFSPILNSRGETSPGPVSPQGNIMMNLNSEAFGIPFGMLMVFKTRGNNNVNGATEPTGAVLAAVYLEYAMISSWNISVQTNMVTIAEGVGIQFDRVVPVSLPGSWSPGALNTTYQPNSYGTPYTA